MSFKGKFLPYLAVTISCVTWGFSFLFTKSVLERLQPFQLLGYRFLLAAVVLTVLAALRLIRIRLTAEKLKGMMLIALLQPVLYFLGETFGVKLTSATESGILIALVPIAVSVCSVFLLKERLGLFNWISITVCVGGVVLIVAARGASGSSGQLVGVLSLLGAIVAAGFYTPLSRKMSRQSTPMEITFVMMWVGAVVFNAIGILMHKGGFAEYFNLFGNMAEPAVIPVAANGAGVNLFDRIPVFVQLLYLGILSSVVAFFCLNYGLSHLESTVVGTFTNLVPVITVFAGVVIGGETLLPFQIVGAVLILAGIWGTARRKPVRAAGAPQTLPVQHE